MDNDKRDPVIINNERKSNPLGWIIGLVVVLVLLLAFFSMGGFGLFSETDGTDGGTETINVDTPDNINVQPSAN